MPGGEFLFDHGNDPHVVPQTPLAIAGGNLRNGSDVAGSIFTPFVGSLLIFTFKIGCCASQNTLPCQSTLVTIDERSMSLSEVSPEEIAESRPLKLMKAGFPWSREVYAALTEKLMAAGAPRNLRPPLFPAPKRGDDAFASVLRANPGKVILASSFENPDSQDRGAKTHALSFPNDNFREAVDGNWGGVNLPVWRDNKVRSVYTFRHGLRGHGDSVSVARGCDSFADHGGFAFTGS